MSMLRAVAWGMVDLYEVESPAERRDIKREVRMELEPNMLWISGTPHPHQPFKLSRLRNPPQTLFHGSFRECCQEALALITQGGNQ